MKTIESEYEPIALKECTESQVFQNFKSVQGDEPADMIEEVVK